MSTSTNVKVAVNYPTLKKIKRVFPLPVLKHVNVVGNLEEIKIYFARDVDTENEKNNKAESFTTISQAELDILETKHESVLEDD